MKNEFALFMSNQMVDKDLTLREVSRRSGINTVDLSRIERGKMYPPKGEVLDKLAIALELGDKQTDEMISLAETVNSKSVDEVDHIIEGLFDPNPVFISPKDIWKWDTDWRGLKEKIIDENTFKDKEQS